MDAGRLATDEEGFADLRIRTPGDDELQDFPLPARGLVANIVSFNVGVEIGQILALTAVLLALGYWRTRPGFDRHAFVTNTLLMTGGFLLIGRQLSGYFLST